MSAKNRADLITKLYKFVKKEYTAVTPPSNRLVLEHMLYGCCLENSTFEAADEAFAKLQENFFDWNEVRVTTVEELAELMKGLNEPTQAAVRLKKTLHGIFESYYQFDIDFLVKENLSKAVTQFEKFPGVTPFVVSHVAQNGLGGHSIPLDRSAMMLFYTLGIVTEEESKKFKVSGLERTIPKAKGVEFSTLMHQLAVAFSGSPHSTSVRAQLLKIAPDAKERFPKRGAKKKAPEKASPQPAQVTSTTQKSTAGKTSKAHPAKIEKIATVKKKSAAKKPTAKSPAVKKKATKSKTAKKKTATKKTPKKSAKKKAPARKKLPAKSSTTKGPASKRLAKGKPR